MFVLFVSSLLVGFLPFLHGRCPNLCNHKGDCNTLNQCVCSDNHYGIDCSYKRCPMGIPWVGYPSAADVLHTAANEVECSHMGTCNVATGICTCKDGFSGHACERMTCPNDCSDQGQCLTLEQIAPLQNDRSLLYTTTYTSPWDAQRVTGCVCDKPYTGHDCSERECPKGDDPFTTGQVDEIQILNCLCSGCTGTFYLTFQDEQTVDIAIDATVVTVKAAIEALEPIRTIDITFDGETDVCAATGTSTAITFTTNPGDMPAFQITSNLVGGTLSLSTGGTAGLYGTPISSQDGTRENVECAGRGLCDTSTGTCTCEEGFLSSDGAGNAGRLGDCGFFDVEVTPACPGDGDGGVCNDHGTCSAGTDYVCTCDTNYYGYDCSLRKCPTGRVWWEESDTDDINHQTFAECSGKGDCDTATGTCDCFDGFTGSSCNKLTCATNANGECSGHGKCRTIAELGNLVRVDGVSTSVPYGERLNTMDNWDAQMIRGCDCDLIKTTSGDGALTYEGHDCSIRRCPTGDDPWTENQVNEIQIINCAATGGTFKLSFRGETTLSISATATADEFEERLTLLPTIGDVTITIADSVSTVCALAQTTIEIEFLSNAGDLPLLETASNSLTHTSGGGSVVLTILDSVDGTKEDVECNNRGLCNYATGICTCQENWGSSDGQGNAGKRNDCGHRDPFALQGSL